MGCLTVCLLVLFGLSGWTAATSLVGGWSAKPLDGDPKYAELAHYAVSTKTDGLENYDTVLELVGVRTQVVAGTNYELKFKTAESSCKVADGQYSKESCQPTSTTPKATCTAVVLERLWEGHRSVTSYTCEE